MTNEELEFSVAELRELVENIGTKFGSFTEGEFFPLLVKVLGERFGLDVIASLHRRLDEQTGVTKQ